MKVQLKRNGVLEITAETELEAYALDHWHNMQLSAGVSCNFSIMHTDLFEPDVRKD